MALTEVIPITSEDIENAKTLYNKNESDITESIEHLKLWLKKQQHLPQGQDNAFLERFLLRNKFRVEETKIKLDNYYTLRGLHSNLFKEIDPLCPAMQQAKQAAMWVPMPKLTPTLERVSIWRIKDNKLYLFLHCMMHALSIQEIQLFNDYAVSERLVLDLKGFSLSCIKSVELNALRSIMQFHQEAYSARVSGIDFLNAPNYMEILLRLIKAAVKPKLFSKIKIHEDFDSLHKIIPKECLPADYGGSCDSAELINDKVNKLLVQKRDFLLKNAEQVSDETKRIGKSYFTDIYFGTDGSFRQLNLD